MNGESDSDNDAYDENHERQEAEIELIQAAYSPDEAWFTVEEPINSDTKTRAPVRRLHRRLELPIDSENDKDPLSACIPVELVLTLPPSYPSDIRAIPKIDAALSDAKKATTRSTTKHSAVYRKSAIDVLPHLLKVCRTVASEYAGSESVFLVLSEAELWINEEWPKFCSGETRSLDLDNEEQTANSQQRKCDVVKDTPKTTVLGRKLIYSHHIIADSKRKAIGDLAKDFKLGGYFKIGWPGIIILEGREEDCQSFCKEIRKFRWQYLVVRGEEHEEIHPGDETTNLDDLRRFPIAMKELGEDKMSYLSEVCRKAGLQDLFLTSMKIYKAESDKTDKIQEAASEIKEDVHHGILVLVDHMNDPKGYIKWLQKACKSAGCSCLVRHCFLNDGGTEGRSWSKSHPQATTKSRVKPIIVVGLIGEDQSSLKQVLKRWRTSLVDVDSKGNPCRERMMDVLVEGALEFPTSCDGDNNDNAAARKLLIESQSTEGRVSRDELESILKTIGGSSWVGAFRNVIQNRQPSKTKSDVKETVKGISN